MSIPSFRSALMTSPASFPHRISRAISVTAPPPDTAPAETSENAQDVASSPASWPWRRAALLLSIAAQLITIAALERRGPHPGYLDGGAASDRARAAGPGGRVRPAPVARMAAPLAVVVLVVGVIGQMTDTGLFFVPALAAMTVAAVRLWRERG
jgi:hypothetical protein